MGFHGGQTLFNATNDTRQPANLTLKAKPEELDFHKLIQSNRTSCAKIRLTMFFAMQLANVPIGFPH
jgi:hypothetical protein